MNKIKLGLFLLTLALASCHAQNTQSTSPTQVAVVELFTSEGCSSCPPADRLLAAYADDSMYDGVRVYTLAYHVDYWDHLGWRDSFSSTEFSDRQRMYADALNLSSVYTPQAVVNGSKQFVGSDESALKDALHKLLSDKNELRFAKLSLSKATDSRISYKLNGDIRDCEIHVAIVTAQVSVNVRRGENRGRLLSHSHVVRRLISVEAARIGEITLPHSEGDFAIIFVQEKNSKKILAAGRLDL